MINRTILIQMIIDKFNFHHYLEIGIDWGKTFIKINTRFKIAVDPIMKIGKWTRREMIKNNYWNIFNRYYSMTSDDFFYLKILY